MMEVPEIGVHHDVPFERYCAWPCVNNSSLGPAMQSAAHYRHAKENAREDTDAFRFGRLCHAGKLEPMAVLRSYTVMPDLTDGIDAKNVKATKEYKQRVADWEAQNSDKQVMTQQEFDDLSGILMSLQANSLANQWLTTDGDAEVSIVWDDRVTGLRCKARIDKVTTPTLLTDLKTTREVMKFGKAIVDYGYDRQAAFYLDGWHAVTGNNADFAFVAAEKSAPYGVQAARLAPAAVQRGRQQYRAALQVIQHASESGRWDGYDNPDCFDVPAWALPRAVLVYMGGNVLEVAYEGE